MVRAGPVNTYILDSSDGCVLIDTGVPGKAEKILAGIEKAGKCVSDIRHIILTHAHPDHIGSFAALKKRTHAKAYMHPADTQIAIAGTGFRPLKAAPGLLRGIMFKLCIARGSVEGAPIDYDVENGDVLPGGLQVIHVPGHCAGQIALLWPHRGGVLIGADVCANIMGLGLSLGYEDLELGRCSLRELSALNFQIACFGHGKPILRDASRRFRELWLPSLSITPD